MKKWTSKIQELTVIEIIYLPIIAHTLSHESTFLFLHLRVVRTTVTLGFHEGFYRLDACISFYLKKNMNV